MQAIKTKPIIGIVPSFDEGVHIPAGGGNVKRIYIRHEYTHMLAEVGAVPLILNPDMTSVEITELCDGIVLSGGEDINPRFYGQDLLEQPRPRYHEPDTRFEWESELIQACDAARVPILGICYGLQRLNVYYGGTLLQDIETLRPENIGHDLTEHDIRIHGEFLNMTGLHRIASRHHQAIDRLAEGFEIKAEAPDGIIEAIEGYGHFGMQWHPESDETGAHVYRAFVEHCSRRQ
jgi:putative glutamine amidotransferase